MSNRSHNFTLALNTSTYAVQDLAINVDGSTPPAGQRKRLHDLPNNLKITNAANNNVFIRWMNEDEGDGTDGEWNGIILEGGAAIIIQNLKGSDKPLRRVAAKLSIGAGNLEISAFDYDNIFE